MNGFQRLAALALTAAGAVFFCGVLAATPPTASVDATVHRAMQTFQVPGIAVAVVTGGDVVHTQGYGTRSVASDEAVDARTLFRIGSVSKAFTAVALAMLVDEGALRWDDPVIDHLPEFRMHDPWVTRELTVRDLLTHRSGLPLGAGDLLIFPEGNATPGEVVLALRHLEPATSFRSEFAYDNLLYIVAGELVARVAGIEFADFMEQRVLQPLGMGRLRRYRQPRRESRPARHAPRAGRRKARNHHHPPDRRGRPRRRHRLQRHRHDPVDVVSAGAGYRGGRATDQQGPIR